MAAEITVLELTDDSSVAEARALVVAKAPEHGATYVVQQSPAEVAEGSLSPRRVAVIEFENVEGARAFLATNEYAELKVVRAAAGADVSVVLVDGS